MKGMSDFEDLGLPGERREDDPKSSEYREVISPVVSNFGGSVVTRQRETRSVPVREVGEMSLEKKATVIKCVEEAMNMMGRTGKEVFLEIVYRRYGVVIDDVVDAPQKFMYALELYHGHSASIMERHALDGIEQRLKVSASSLEEAVAALGGRARPIGHHDEITQRRKVVVEQKRATRPGRFEYHCTFSP